MPKGKDCGKMYKKAMSILVIGSFLFFSCLICVKGLDATLVHTKPVERLKLELAAMDAKLEAGERTGGRIVWQVENPDRKEKEVIQKKEVLSESSGLGIANVAVSGERVVDYNVLERSCLYLLSDEDLEALLRIVEAEAGCEDEEGKLLVANVVLNRVADEAFPDTVQEVVFQQENGVTQFSPVADGSYYEVKVSQETISAVGRALLGEVISQGALYFAARKYADSGRMKWFDDNLTRLFAHGGHEFFK